MEKIVIFGASLGGERAMRSLSRGTRVVAFCDNAKAKHGTRFHDVPVIAPAELAGLPYDRVLIASSSFDPIFDQLLDLGIPAERIDVLDAHLLEGRTDPTPRARGWLIGVGITALAILILAGFGVYHLVFCHG